MSKALSVRPSTSWVQHPSFGWPPSSRKKFATVWSDSSGLRVLRSASKLKDGSGWIHVSVSRVDRIPSWEDLTKVKNEFIGEHREAYQVLASSNDHVNLHQYCLHLWAPTDGLRRVANLQDLASEVEL